MSINWHVATSIVISSDCAYLGFSFPPHQDEDEGGDKVDGKLVGKFAKRDLDVSI